MKKFNWKDCYTAYINLDHRPDRKERMEQELKRVDIKAERVSGIYPHEYTGDPFKAQAMLNHKKGALGCHLSQVKVMETALCLNKSAFVLEDDLIFATDVHDRLNIAQDFLNELPDWDVFWLGGTFHLNPPRWHAIDNPAEPVCSSRLGRDVELTNHPHILKTYGIWSTYAYIVNIKNLSKILHLLDLHMYESVAIDWLFIKLMPQLQCYSFVPAMVKQYDSQSDIGTGIHQFSNFAQLGSYWFTDKIDMFNPANYNWAEARIK
jgi:GR25 family glycosyltransferase involved in LPS biosynthesis